MHLGHELLPPFIKNPAGSDLDIRNTFYRIITAFWCCSFNKWIALLRCLAEMNMLHCWCVLNVYATLVLMSQIPLVHTANVIFGSGIWKLNTWNITAQRGSKLKVKHVILLNYGPIIIIKIITCRYARKGLMSLWLDTCLCRRRKFWMRRRQRRQTGDLVEPLEMLRGRKETRCTCSIAKFLVP